MGTGGTAISPSFLIRGLSYDGPKIYLVVGWRLEDEAYNFREEKKRKKTKTKRPNTKCGLDEFLASE